MFPGPTKIKGSELLPKLVASWKEVLAQADWKGCGRADFSLEHSIWLGKATMRDGTLAMYLNAMLAKRIEARREVAHSQLY